MNCWTKEDGCKDDNMDTETNQQSWEQLSHEEKNHQLFLKQKALLDTFLEKHAISKEQYEKSLHDLTEKNGTQHQLSTLA